jgi:23S rRNA maturation-related 3'-5' exoribonuclease YhaM
MDAQEKHRVFEKELLFIKNANIKNFTELAIKSMPDYFFEVPASSTGKYHPAYSLGTGGLLRHTRAAIRIAVELFRIDWWGTLFTPDEKDLALSALFLHDGWKSGIQKSEYSLSNHPLIAAKAISENVELKTILSEEMLSILLGCITSHMGQWNKDYKTQQVLMPAPVTELQRFVHLADYLASRKCIVMDFNIPLSSFS